MSVVKARAIPSASDRELVCAARAGDNEAFAQLYQRHADHVYQVLTRILGPVAGRDDALQEVFIQLHRALPTFRGDSKLSTFVYRITVRVALRSARRERSQGDPLPAVQIDACVSRAVSPSKRAQDRQILQRAFEAIAQIKPERRVAFVLAVVEGQSYEEVGRILEISPDATKQRVLRARREIVRVLKKIDRRNAKRRR